MKARIVNKYNPYSIKLSDKIRNDINAAYDLWLSLTNGAGNTPFISFEEWYNGLSSTDCKWCVEGYKGEAEDNV